MLATAYQKELIMRSAALLEAMQANPSDVDSHLELVYVLLQLQRKQTAQKLLELTPKMTKPDTLNFYRLMLAKAEARSERASVKKSI